MHVSEMIYGNIMFLQSSKLKIVDKMIGHIFHAAFRDFIFVPYFVAVLE